MVGSHWRLNKWIQLITPVFQIKNVMSTPPVSKASSSPDIFAVYKALSKLQGQKLNIYRLKKRCRYWAQQSKLASSNHVLLLFYTSSFLLYIRIFLRIPDFNKKSPLSRWYFQQKPTLDWRNSSVRIFQEAQWPELDPQDTQGERRKWTPSRYPLNFTYTPWHVCLLPHNK